MTDFAFVFFLGFFSFFLGSVAAGGAGLVFLAIGVLFLPLSLLPVLLSVTGTASGAYRTILYRHDMNWKILGWLLPGTLAGGVLGASVFSSLVTTSAAHWLQGGMGALLVFSGASGLTNVRLFNLPPKRFWFLPLGFVTSFISGLLGASSPIINALFQKFPLSPVQVVGTKSFNIFALQLFKTITYAFFFMTSASGVWQESAFSYIAFLSVFSGLGAIGGSYVGKQVLTQMKTNHFNMILNVCLVLSGFHFLFQAVS